MVNRKLLIHVPIKIESVLYLKRNVRFLYIVWKMSGAAARTGEFKEKRKKVIIGKWGKKLPLKTGNHRIEDCNLVIYNKIHGKSG